VGEISEAVGFTVKQ